ncbi:MAG: hypothetical protein STSR0008_23720 [Ignavibacterium sp.]
MLRTIMNIKTKKLIAREFIFIVSVLSIGILTFLFIYLYNYYNSIQVDNKSELIRRNHSVADKINNKFKSKIEEQEWFFKIMNKNFDIEDYNNYEMLWTRNEQLLKADSFKIIWLTWNDDIKIPFMKMGFNSVASLEDFIRDNSLNTEELKNKSKYDSLQLIINNLYDEKRSIENNMLSYTQQKELSLKVIFALIIILFILRYLIYGTLWSIKTLKIKND